MGKTRSPYLLALVVVLALLAVIGFGAGASGVSLGQLAGVASRLSADGATVVANVNGEGITLAALERTKAVLQATAAEQLADAEAYTQALDRLIQDKTLVQEARRRGLDVTEAEAQAYWAQVQVDAKQSPELAQFLADEAAALGVDGATFAARMVATYQEALLVGKLYDQISAEAPAPTTEAVDLFLAQRPGPNAIVLIPIQFTDLAAAQSTYAELQTLAQAQNADQFTTTFDAYARRLGNHSLNEFVHERHHYADADRELPGYVRDALDKPEGAMGLYASPDGSATIYLVLKSVHMSQAEARAAAQGELTEENRLAYSRQLEQSLVDQAAVEVFQERLPAAARAAASR
jgi:hypothetical protein